MTSASFRARPSRYDAEEQAGSDRKRQDNGACPSARDRAFRICNNRIDSTISVRPSDTRYGTHDLNQIGAVVSANAAMA
jgi:hypothetical protein